MKHIWFLLIILCSNQVYAKAGNGGETKATVQGPSQHKLSFMADDSSIRFIRTGIRFDFTEENIYLGKYKIGENSFNASINGKSLDLDWDTSLVPYGDLAVLNRQGGIVMSTHISKGKNKISGSDLDKLISAGRIRFCINSRVSSIKFSTLCSTWYGLNKDHESYSIITGIVNEPSQLIIENNSINEKTGFVDLPIGSPARFFVKLKNDLTYEFVSEVPDVEILDFEELKNEEVGILIKGAELASQDDRGKGNWTTTLTKESNSFDVYGKGGGVFNFNVEILNPPSSSDRLYLSTRYYNSTYRSTYKISLGKEGVEPKLETLSLEKIGDVNRKSISFEGARVLSYIDIYRGLPGSAGVRLSASSVPQGGHAIGAEAFGEYWFEDILNLDSYLFTRQRWGAEFNYSQSLNDFKTNEDALISYSSMSFNIAYRFMPGIKFYNPAFGFILSFNDMKIGELGSSLLGYGIYWSRTPPQFIESFIHQILPKNRKSWLDMRVINYSTSLDNEISVEKGLLFQAALKADVAPKIFLELTGGAMNVKLLDSLDGSAELVSFVGTAGVGILF